jgi:HD-like signal output (HDOD) protein
MGEKKSFIDIVNMCIESDKVTLPVFNTAAMRIQEELAKKEPSSRVIEQVITTDQSLSSEVLKIANSAFYRGIAEVTTVRNAIMRLGMKEIGHVVLLASSRNHFKCSDKSINQIMKKLWQHSVGCGYGTVWLAKRHEYGVDQSHAFFAGLFHDVGMLFILMVIEFIKRKQPEVKLTNALLMEAMGKLHTAHGYKLLMKWNMPEMFCIIARDHHTNAIDTSNTLLLLVRMANMVCHKIGIGLYKDDSLLLPATLEANELNLSEIDIAELEITLEDTASLTS